MNKNLYENKHNSEPVSSCSRQGGVTLVELMVVIFIFILMSGVILFNYGKFRSSTSIQNLADDIALSIRKAQSYAIGVRGSDSVFDLGYGIHFSLNSVTEYYAGSNKLFVLFADVNPNNTYDYVSGSETCSKPISKNECLEALGITSADQITSIFLGISDKDQSIGGKDSLDIVFNRPNPEPIFCYRKDNSGGGLGGPKEAGDGGEQSSSCEKVTISYVKILISNIADNTIAKTITVWNNGQISVS